MAVFNSQLYVLEYRNYSYINSRSTPSLTVAVHEDS